MGTTSKRSTTTNGGGGAPPGPPELLTVKEAAARCRASVSSLRRWASDASTGFPAAIVLGPPDAPSGQALRFWRHEVDAWLASRPRHQPKRGEGK